MELTKTKLNNILKKYRQKLADHEKEWAETCRKVALNNTETHIAHPSIYDHESHNSKGNQLFKALMKEFEGYEVFVKNGKNSSIDNLPLYITPDIVDEVNHLWNKKNEGDNPRVKAHKLIQRVANDSCITCSFREAEEILRKITNK